MLPQIYRNANVRNATPVCPSRNRLGVGFELVSGEVIRLALDANGVAFLRKCLDDYSSDLAGTQSPGSRLISSESRSVPSEGEKV